MTADRYSGVDVGKPCPSCGVSLEAGRAIVVMTDGGSARDVRIVRHPIPRCPWWAAGLQDATDPPDHSHGGPPRRAPDRVIADPTP